MKFICLPELALVKIFLYVPGGSLHRCRQVCKAWNDFIIKNIWSSIYSRNQLEDRLDSNWGNGVGDVKFALLSKTIDTSFNHLTGPVIVVAASESYVVIGPGPPALGRTTKELAVMNIDTEELWQLDESTLFGGEPEIKMEVFIDNNILAVWLKQRFDFTAIKVWSTRTKALLFEEECLIDDIVFDRSTPSSSLSRLIHVLEDKVEMLSFNDNTLVSRFSSPQDFEGRSGFSSFVFPHILHCQFLGVFVLKVDEETEQIVTIKHLPDSDNFADGQEVLLDAIYVSSTFVASTSRIEQYPYDDVWTNVRNCVIKILNDEGQLIRKLELDSYQRGHMDTKIHLHRNWLLVERLRDFTIFKLDMEQLLCLDASDNTPIKKLELGREAYQFYKIILSKTSISGWRVDYLNGKLELKRLDFWAID